MLIVYVVLCTLYQRRHPTPPRPFSYEDGLDALPPSEPDAPADDAPGQAAGASVSPQGFTLVRRPEDAPSDAEPAENPPSGSPVDGPADPPSEPSADSPAADQPSKSSEPTEPPDKAEPQPPEQEK